MVTKKSEASKDVVVQLAAEKMNKLQDAGYDIFFTDGSVINNLTGAAFVHVNTNTTKSFFVEKKLSSMTAEIIAFLQVIVYSEEHNIRKLAILTDSLSGMQALSSKNHKNYIIDNLAIQELTLMKLLTGQREMLFMKELD
ncbi:uncharacterized protein [Musca autumnalis]|uniref:uncharacterized protein n=1 Tax=Musca autumnalis TaxID=221902 RepID=UPI003CEB8F29